MCEKERGRVVMTIGAATCTKIHDDFVYFLIIIDEHDHNPPSLPRSRCRRALSDAEFHCGTARCPLARHTNQPRRGVFLAQSAVKGAALPPAKVSRRSGRRLGVLCNWQEVWSRRKAGKAARRSLSRAPQNVLRVVAAAAPLLRRRSASSCSFRGHGRAPAAPAVDPARGVGR